jgi:hypothetical protein
MAVLWPAEVSAQSHLKTGTGCLFWLDNATSQNFNCSDAAMAACAGWALAATTSRAFAVDGVGKPRAMLPVIDMCNHSFSPNCDISKEADGTIKLVAECDIASGQQLLLSYGALDNHTLLLDYGFCVPENPYDNVALNVSIDFILVRVAF